MADAVGPARLRDIRLEHRPPVCPIPQNPKLYSIPEITTVRWSSHPHPVPFVQIKWESWLPGKHRQQRPWGPSRDWPRTPVLCVRSDSIISYSSQNIPGTAHLLYDINSILWERAMEGCISVLTTISRQLSFSGTLFGLKIVLPYRFCPKKVVFCDFFFLSLKTMLKAGGDEGLN